MRTPLIVANWKMHKTAAEAADFCQLLMAEFRANGDTIVVPDRTVAVCGPYTTLPALQENLRDSVIGYSAVGSSVIGYGAQNMHWETAGAYTGEVSAPMLQEYGCTYVILGHSERREYYAETDVMVNKKTLAALTAGLTPIVCVGENLELRRAGKYVQHVETQVQQAFHGVNTAEYSKLVIAYEPIWAIGTGETATPAQAQEVHAVIRELVGNDTRILYGGSVKPDNMGELMQQTDIDGVLVGGASLDIDEFLAIIRNS